MSQQAPGPHTRVVVLSRDGCHLCDNAIEVVRRVCGELDVGWQVRDIDTDPELLTRYTDQVPVTMVDGRVHDIWRVDPDKLRQALGVG